jgi:hypothetical protein
MAFTYEKGVELLSRGRNGQKKLDNHTYLHRIDAQTIAVRLHDTDVVAIHDNGTYTLNTGGWQTVTTKDRINKFSPARLYQRNGLWYVGEYVFEEGMTVDVMGKPVGRVKSASVIERKKRALDKKVRTYINGYADHAAFHKLALPSAGDCFGCQFSENGGAVNDMHAQNPLGFDHLLMHMDEKYYVPSLLLKAIKVHGYRDPGFIWQRIDQEVQEGRTDWIKRELRQYFRKIKPELLKLM